MKLRKIILCAAVSLTAFGASLGLLETGSYLRAAFQPVIKVEIKPLEPFESPVYAPSRLPAFKTRTFTPPEETKPEEETRNWSDDGYYYLSGDYPKGFADFEYLQLMRRVDNEKNGKPGAVEAEGLIETKKGTFEITWISIAGNRISLVSEKQKGVSYQFDGKFVDDVTTYQEDGVEYEQTISLRGRLTKWRNGVKIAESKAKFTFSVGC